MGIVNMDPETGRRVRENNSLINLADLAAPIPNGDEIVSFAAGSVRCLVPIAGSVAALISPSVECYVRFGAVPSNISGIHLAVNEKFRLTSWEEMNTAQIYAVTAGIVFVSYVR